MSNFTKEKSLISEPLKKPAFWAKRQATLNKNNIVFHCPSSHHSNSLILVFLSHKDVKIFAKKRTEPPIAVKIWRAFKSASKNTITRMCKIQHRQKQLHHKNSYLPSLYHRTYRSFNDAVYNSNNLIKIFR